MLIKELGKSGDLKGDLEKNFLDIEERFNALGTIESEHKEFGALLKVTRGLVDEMNSRNRFANGQLEGTRFPRLITQKQFRKWGWNAALRAKTEISVKWDRYGKAIGYAENEHPLAKMADASDALITFIARYRINPKDSMGMRTLRESDVWEDLWEPAFKEAEAFLKGLGFDTGTAGEGLEWIPNEYSPRWFDKVRLSTDLLPFFERLDMSKSPQNFRVWLNDLLVFYTGEAVDDTQPSDWTKVGNAQVANVSAKCTLTARKFTGFVVESRELDEDAVGPSMAKLAEGLAIATGRGWEDALINGDRTNVGASGATQDSDTTAANDRRKAFDGMRKIALANTGTKKDASNNRIDTTANWATYMASARGQMGVYGVRARRCCLVVGPKVFNQIVNVPEFRTLYAFGGQATALGVSPEFRPDGLALIVSEFIREDLNATGVYDGTTTTRTCAILSHEEAWKIGNMRATSIQVLDQVFALWDQDALVVTSRIAANQAIAASNTKPHTQILFNIAST